MAVATVEKTKQTPGPPAGIEIPTERRMVAPLLGETEFREEEDKLTFIGHAAVFDRLSEDLGGFRERIQRGAFRKVLDSTPDVRFLGLNHNPDLIMARTTNGTMDLSEDPKGLRVYAELAPITAAKDLRVSVKRGDVSQMSFGFRVDKDVWTEEDDELVRTVVSFSRLYDVSPVVFPAYPQTDSTMRSLVCDVEVISDKGEVHADVLADLAWRIHRGERDATDKERRAIDQAFQKTSTVSPWMAQRALLALAQEPELQGAIPGQKATVTLEDAPSGEPMFRLAARQRRLHMRAI